MKLRIVSAAVLASAVVSGYSSALSAEICYDVGGSILMENVTDTLQIGNISLDLTEKTSGELAFSETGSLVGNITGSPALGVSLLAHKARFAQGDSFRTEDDFAWVTSVLNADADDVPCGFSIFEQITSIPKGTGFFKDVSSVQVNALGTVFNCPGFNENSFVLSGFLCVE